MKLVEIEPGRWRIDRREVPVARSSLPCPSVISDTMPPTEQVNGKFYTSKREFRAVGRALGLTEVGTEQVKPKTRSSGDRAVKEGRRKALQAATEKYRAGHRPKG